MGEETEQEQQSDEVVLRVRFHFPEGMQSHFANNVLVQAGQNEFFVSFFEIRPPVLLGSPEENKAELARMGQIQAECVSRIVVPPEVASALVGALQIELEKYKSQRQNQ